MQRRLQRRQAERLVARRPYVHGGAPHPPVHLVALHPAVRAPVPRHEPLAVRSRGVAQEVHRRSVGAEQPRRLVQHVGPLAAVPQPAGAQHQRLGAGLGLAGGTVHPVRHHPVHPHAVGHQHLFGLPGGGAHHGVGSGEPRPHPAGVLGQPFGRLAAVHLAPPGNHLAVHGDHHRRREPDRGVGELVEVHHVGAPHAGQLHQPCGGGGHVGCGGGHPFQAVVAPHHLHPLRELRQPGVARLADGSHQHLAAGAVQRARQGDGVVPHPAHGVGAQQDLHRRYTLSRTAATSTMRSAAGSKRSPAARHRAQSTAARPPQSSGGDARVSRAVPRYASALKS